MNLHLISCFFMSDPGNSRDNRGAIEISIEISDLGWKREDENSSQFYGKMPQILQIWQWWCFISSISIKKMKIVISEISPGHPNKRKSRSTNWISRSSKRKRRSTKWKSRSTNRKRRSTFSKRRSTKRKSRSTNWKRRSTFWESWSTISESRSIFCLFRPIFEKFWSILPSGDWWCLLIVSFTIQARSEIWQMNMD